MPSAGRAESSELFADALVKMLPHMFNTDTDWSVKKECVSPALLALNGSAIDEAFAKRLNVKCQGIDEVI